MKVTTEDVPAVIYTTAAFARTQRNYGDASGAEALTETRPRGRDDAQ